MLRVTLATDRKFFIDNFTGNKFVPTLFFVRATVFAKTFKKCENIVEGLVPQGFHENLTKYLKLR